MHREKLKKAIIGNRYEWRKHTIERLAERKISQDDIIQAILEGEQIEEYPKAYPYPGALFFAEVGGRPLHTVVAYDDKNDWVYIVTVYVPDLDHFESDLKTRRRS